ncbi:DUF5518 domain-containing protein [Methanosphaera cuniculi]|uniref:DUF5518 domain-containing protein n=1 Tax=Methanosphaera cuniculi TaxID=1077256 RepID=UPI0026EE2302|nr:DUF5518 domain-containing protein [Methanosphaera cuniculi]
MIKLDYLTSILIGLFIGSFILFIARLLSYPISGIILAIIIAPLVAAFLYNPSNKKKANHRSLRCTASSIILCFIFSLILATYYIPQFNSLLGSADISASMAILIIIAFTIIGGFLIGSIGGSIGATLRNIVSVITFERK